MDEIKKVEEPNEVEYFSTSDRLGINLIIKGEKKKVNFENGKLTLNKISDKELIEALDKVLDEQYVKDEKGFVIDDNGNRIVRPGRIIIPAFKSDVFKQMLASQPVRVELGDEVYEIPPDELRKMLKEKIKKGTK